MVTPRGGFGRERLERLARALLELLALGLHPALEVRRVAQIEAVEERPRVQRHRLRRVAALERGLEALNVARDDVGVQPQLGGAEQQLRRVEIAPQRVAGLLEESVGVLAVALGPEVGNQLVAAQAALAGGGEQREERERLAARGGTAALGAILFDRKPAQRPHGQHRRSV